MRSLSNDIITKSGQTNQTIAADAEPYVSLRISRNKTILTDMNLTEKVKVRKLDADAITDGDIAVCHPRFRGENTKIWCCYLDEGKLRVRWVYDQENITEQKWTVVHAGAPDAIACAICFDSDVVENARGIAEFVTGSENPLIFYVTPEGALICLTLGGAIIEETLAAANVTDVTAVRGPSSKNGSWDLGVTVFFLMGGALFYRQMINGTWYDAEQVSLGITGETIVKIDAFNTWDYRVGVQCLTQSGKLYQILSYTEGLAIRGTEHVGFKTSATASTVGINYSSKFENEHSEFGVEANAILLYAFSAVPTSVQNIEDEDENWGTTIEVTFDYPITAGTAAASMFTLQDSNGFYYACQSFSISEGGYKLTLIFADFNLADRADDMTLTYTKPSSGGLMSPAVQTDTFSETFVPTGLYNPYNPPDVVGAWNSVDGMTIYVRFDEDILAGVSDSNANHYSISLYEYNYVPDGTLQNTTRLVTSVSNTEDSKVIALGLNSPNISPAVGNVTVIYDGNGGLAGRGGPASTFSEAFTPSGLTWKGNQCEHEHSEFEVSATATLIQVSYSSVQENEHSEFSMSATATLINAHDI